MLLRALAFAVTTGSCAILDDASLEVSLGASGTRSGLDDDIVQVNNAADDPEGMSGIEIEIFGVGDPTKFTARDFNAAGTVPAFRVPTSGMVHFVVDLRDSHGAAIARGSGSWTLEPDISWQLELSRDLTPPGGIGSTECGWFGCDQIWDFTIREDASNYRGETLWVTLYRHVRGACADICDD